MEANKKEEEDKTPSLRESIFTFVVDKLKALRHSTRVWYRLTRTTIRSMYLPDEVHVYSDVLLRGVFALYILPTIVVIVALTHAALQRVVWVLVVPVTQSMERDPYPAGSVVTLLRGLGDIWIKFIPFLTLGMSVATVGHKALNCTIEALIDACSTHKNQDYPLMRARLQFMTRTKFRFSVFSLIFLSLLVFVLFALYTNLVVTWTSGASWLSYTMIWVIVVEVGFVLFTLVHDAPPSIVDLATTAIHRRRRGGRKGGQANTSTGSVSSLLDSTPTSPPGESACATPLRSQTNHSEVGSPMSPPSFDASRSQEGEVAREDSGMPDGYKFFVYVEDNWWEKNIHLMRYIGFVMAVVFSILYGFLRGAVYGLTSFVLTLIYLNVPHQFAYATLSITFGLLNIVRSCHWLHRHRDAVYPFLALLAPYQVILIYSFYYFRHHFLTCLVLVPVNALLISRTIDLVREFDVTARGCVRWYDENHNILPPSLSTLLEDSYEKKHEHVDVVSLDLAIDLKNKQIRYADGRIVQLRRVQVIPYGNSKYYLYSRAFYAYAVPKLLSMQSPGYLSGARFRTARVVLRGITFTFLIVFAIIVSGMILQAAFPFSRPLPVRVEVPEDYSKLTLDHIVVHLDLFSSDYVEPKNSSSTEDLVSRWFGNKRTNHWDTVEPGDLYPHLCTREYHGTSVFEISLLSAAPYLFNREEVETLLRFMNKHLGSDWSLRPRHGAACKYGDSNHAPTGWAGFYDIYSKSRDLSVIAIRGTDLSSFTDFLIDVNMFFETVLYQVLTSVIPGAAIIPPDLVSDMIRLVSIPPSDSVYDLSTAYYANPTPKRYKEDPRRETWAQLTQSRNESLRFCRQNNYHRDFFADVYNHVVYIGSQRDHPGHVLITGHSLGGAVAAVLASQLEVPAVLFSAPGIVLSRKKFNVELRALQKYVLTIVQSNDIVPMMGSHGGEVQHMECLAQTKELCHAMEFIIGSLWRSCESIRNKYPSLKKVL